MPRNTPLALIVVDGYGIAAPSPGNAIGQATKPNFDRFEREYPAITLSASGIMSDKCGVLLGIRKLATLTLAAAASCTSNFHEFFLPFVKVRSTKIQHSSRPALGSNNTAGHFISPGCFPPAPSTAISIIYTHSWTWESANTS